MDGNLDKWIKINKFIENHFGIYPSSAFISEEERAMRRRRLYIEGCTYLITFWSILWFFFLLAYFAV
jgi:hypothetical protein